MGIIIKNATIVDYEGVRRKEVHIEGNKIVEETVKDEVIDAKGKLVVPGFYNTHTHIAMVFLRNVGEGLTLHDWLTKKIWPEEQKVREEILYYSSLLGYVEAMKSGTVCINDMYLKGLEEIIKAGNRAGVRTVISYGMFDIFSSPKEEIKKTLSFISKKENNLTKRAVACHAPYSCSEELIIKGKEIANKNKKLFHIHVSETRKEVMDLLKEKKKRPIEYLNDLNVVDENSLFAHSSWVTKREIRIAGEKRLNVSHNPTSNLKLATGGIMPFEEYLENNANVTIGTDGPASNNNLDMVESIKLTGLLQKHRYWDATKGNPREILKAATLNGAKALGYKAGLIKAGYLADLLIINPKENMVPFGDYYTSIVYSMKRDNVEKVFIDGKIVYDNKPLIEEELLKAKEKLLSYVMREIK